MHILSHSSDAAECDECAKPVSNWSPVRCEMNPAESNALQMALETFRFISNARSTDSELVQGTMPAMKRRLPIPLVSFASDSIHRPHTPAPSTNLSQDRVTKHQNLCLSMTITFIKMIQCRIQPNPFCHFPVVDATHPISPAKLYLIIFTRPLHSAFTIQRPTERN